MSESMAVRDTPLDGALWLVTHGFAVFPTDHPGLEQCAGIGLGHDPATCTDRGKHPSVPFTRAHSRDTTQVHTWFATGQRNVGVAIGGCTGPAGEQLLVVDSDRPGAIEDAATTLGHKHEPTMRVATAKGYHDYYWAPAEMKLGNTLGSLKGIFDGDVRGPRGYVIGPGSVHASGVIYTLADADQHPVAAPEWLLTALTTKPTAAPAPPVGPALPIPMDRLDAYTRKVITAECDAITRAPDGEQNNQINTSAFALGTLVGAGALSENEAREHLLAAARAGGHPEGRALGTIDSGLTAGIAQPRTPWPPVARERTDDFTTLVPEAKRHLSAVPRQQPPAAPATDGTAALAVTEYPAAAEDSPDSYYSRTDDGNALRLVDKHEHEVRYVPQRGKWLRWNGHRWTWDDAGTIREMARTIARALPSGEGEAKHRMRSLSAAGISAMVQMAQTDPRTVALMDRLDAQPLHLNTPGGIVDLSTGTITPPTPAAMHTRSTSVAPDPTMPTPRWAQFLADTFGEDTDIAAFVQRLAGYSASGDTRFHILPFLNGPGGNGKSVFLDVLRIILGDYAATAPNTFLMAGQQQHETEVARLQGLRLVVVSEVNQDARFDEAKMKLLTGGDALTARFMRQDHFTFEPTHHLWLMGNHLPAVKAGGDSFWRRLRLIPFTRNVPPERKIEGLARILADEEGPGILAWMVAGAVDVFSGGLREPGAVMAFTETYAEEEDSLARFMSDRCHLGGGAHVTINTAKLRAAYDDWCRTEGDTPLKPQVFGRELRTRFGIEQTRSNGRRFYVGLSLLAQDDEDRGDR